MFKLKYLLFSFLFFSLVVAEDDDITYSTLYAGPLVTHRQVSEPQNFAIAKEGTLGGAAGGYRYLKHMDIFLNADAMWSFGSLSEENRVNHFLHEGYVEGKLGFTFGALCPLEWTISPYVGLGWYFLHDSFEHLGEDLHYHSWYVPIGVYSQVVFCNWQIGLDLKWLPQIDSLVDSTFVNGVCYRLHKKSSYSIELPISFTVCDCFAVWKFSLVPFFLERRYGLTRFDPHFFPISETARIYGVKLFAGYCF